VNETAPVLPGEVPAFRAVPTFLAYTREPMYCTYVLSSEADRRFSMGTTSELRTRLACSLSEL
jgi:hypothetical protein